MKLTEERTPYLLMDFGEYEVANMVVLRIDDAQQTFKSYQQLVARFNEQESGVARVQFNDDYSHYLKVDIEDYDFLSEWETEYMFIHGDQEEIEAFIKQNEVIAGDSNFVTVYGDGAIMLHVYDNHDLNKFDEFFSEFIEELL